MDNNLEEKLENLKAQRTPESYIQSRIKILTIILTVCFSLGSCFYVYSIYSNISDISILFALIPFSYILGHFLSYMIINFLNVFMQSELEQEIIMMEIDMEIDKKHNKAL